MFAGWSEASAQEDCLNAFHVIQLADIIIIIIYLNYKWVFTGGSGTTIRHNTQITHHTQTKHSTQNYTKNK
jgi:hypothetical protein